MHFVGELVCTYKDHKRKGYNAICLNSNIAVITAWANDKNYNDIFARQLQALGGCEGDIFIGLSTSGKSKNILNAFKMADKLDMQQILITGKNNAYPCNWIIRFNTKDTPRIQEHTIFFLHSVCGIIEKLMEAD
jgi:D-sedoheptulose 7-phosphate isomerase